MWIYIPDTDEKKEAWVGTIQTSNISKSWGSFELIRHINDGDNLYQITPFQDRDVVIGLLDHQQRCTIIRPIVNHIDPGKLGHKYDFPRTRIEGQFQSLLTDIAIEDSNKEIFKQLRFESDAFNMWYAAPAYTASFDVASNSNNIVIDKTKKEEISISNFGKIILTLGVKLTPKGGQDIIKSTSIFNLEFSNLVSLNKINSTCYALERLFGFLIGHRGEFPHFKVWTNEIQKVGNHNLPLDGVLTIGGVEWLDKKPPHPMEYIHRNGIDGISLEKILLNFLSFEDDILTRIHAIEFSRFFSVNINDRFAVIMPILEQYIKNKYMYSDEISYQNEEKRFFKWIDTSNDNNLIEFSKKHIEVKKRKSPSLKKLLERLILNANQKGFNFPIDFADRLQRRRGTIFHSSPKMDNKDIKDFFEEIKIATGLLMLKTYEDLGIDISYLSKDYSKLRDFREFLS